MKKHLKNLGLVLSGVVLGVAVSFSGEISAATSKLLGGKVGKVMTVSLDDKKIGDAPVIGGTSYVPVRTAANELGLEVAVEGNEIKLTSPEEVTESGEVTVPSNEDLAQKAKEEQAELDLQAEELNAKNAKIRELEQKVETAKRSISSSKKDIESVQKMLDDAKAMATAGNKAFESVAKSYEEDIATSEKYIVEQEKVLTGLEAQLAALK
ncbi:hypothetical protein [Paenibacillus amylolyticus]|uniref:hypothetical protein n=1 Tax=Paenibacillus amylolyticus TaxID=1451 RepID=UPI003D99BD82